jgi:hypothetical protein
MMAVMSVCNILYILCDEIINTNTSRTQCELFIFFVLKTYVVKYGNKIQISHIVL